MVDAAVASVDVVLLRCEAMKQLVRAMQDQNKNSEIMIAELLAKSERAESELQGVGRELAFSREEERRLREDNETNSARVGSLQADLDRVNQEKQSLQDRLSKLEESRAVLEKDKAGLLEELKTSQSQSAAVTAELKRAEAETKKYKDAVTDVFVESWNNAVQQVELRNWNLDITLDSCSPNHEVEGSSIVFKKDENTTEVIWTADYLDSDPDVVGEGVQLSASPEGDQPSKGKDEVFPQETTNEDNAVAVGSVAAPETSKTANAKRED